MNHSPESFERKPTEELRPEIAQASVEDAFFSNTKLVKVLTEAGIHNIAQLSQIPVEKLVSMKNSGPVSLEAIARMLRVVGVNRQDIFDKLAEFQNDKRVSEETIQKYREVATTLPDDVLLKDLIEPNRTYNREAYLQWIKDGRLGEWKGLMFELYKNPDRGVISRMISNAGSAMVPNQPKETRTYLTVGQLRQQTPESLQQMTEGNPWHQLSPYKAETLLKIFKPEQIQTQV